MTIIFLHSRNKTNMVSLPRSLQSRIGRPAINEFVSFSSLFTSMKICYAVNKACMAHSFKDSSYKPIHLFGVC